MKLCSRCEEEKDLTEFYKRTQRKDGYAAWCKNCANEYSAERVKVWRLQTKIRLVAHFGNCCVDCGNSYPPFVMDFDHKNPSQKKFAISSSKIAKWERILEEANKCELVCANCHRVRTHRQRCVGCDMCVHNRV